MIDATSAPHPDLGGCAVPGLPVTVEDITALLRDLEVVRHLPADDPQWVAWVVRKRDLLERIGRHR